ncbi:MAG: gliding motility-associated C-terminal domain-containing protein [Bacteroidota bacterium]|nr:gliding motility-associated C-terminal domain-containing protein [Bacteroidota bacterium]
MRKLVATLIFLSFLHNGKTQNLVLNPSFEGDTCEEWGFEHLPFWNQLFTGDYHTNLCCCPEAYKYPKSGYSYTAIYLNALSFWMGMRYTAREYLIGTLSHELKKNKKYSVTFWVKPSGAIYTADECYTTRNVSLAFISDTSELRKARAPIYGFLLNLPEHVTNTKGDILDYINYTEVTGCYIATGEEKYIVIGNFRDDNESTLVPTSPKSNWLSAYFLVDDVSVVEEKPLLPFSDTSICNTSEINLAPDTSSFKNIRLNGVIADIPIRIKYANIYHFEADYGDCKIEQYVNIETNNCGTYHLYIPNIFSPNGDQINDRWEPYIDTEYQFIQCSIFNRWGNLVYQSKSKASWDGRINNENCLPGVYIYYLELKDGKNITKKSTGDFTLIR